MAPSHRRDSDRVLHAVRNVLLAAGFHEAMTASIVDEKTSQMFSPWTDAAPLRCSMPMLRGADCLRRSLLPSLLESRRINESLANETIELFETAKIYLPRSGPLPDEQPMLALTSGGTVPRNQGHPGVDAGRPAYRGSARSDADRRHTARSPRQLPAQAGRRSAGLPGHVERGRSESGGASASRPPLPN